jgi:cyclopropane fatty-acyl-phospholipid synthase-like methyltransferase
MAEWFEDWFDTEEYLDVYQHRNEQDAKKLVDLIIQNVNIPAGGKVLDMACGTGRHSILFAEKGYSVSAVDLSKNLLKVAKESADFADVKINFVHSDLRSFCVSSKFNLAVNLFTSIGYFEDEYDNFKILKTAYDHLYDNGYFVIDFFNRRYIENNLIPESRDEIFNEKIIQKRSIEGNRVEKQIIINKNGNEKHFHESVRMYYKEELFNAIKSEGFRIRKYFGDSSGKSFDLETSPRIIIIAQK